MVGPCDVHDLTFPRCHTLQSWATPSLLLEDHRKDGRWHPVIPDCLIHDATLRSGLSQQCFEVSDVSQDLHAVERTLLGAHHASGLGPGQGSDDGVRTMLNLSSSVPCSVGCRALRCAVLLPKLSTIVRMPSDRLSWRSSSWCAIDRALRLDQLRHGKALSSGGRATAAAAAMLPRQRRAWRLLLDALLNSARSAGTSRNGTVQRRPQLIALGGSMLAGSECHDNSLPERSEPAACAYPKRFADALCAALAQGTSGRSPEGRDCLDWRSLALGGTTSISVLPVLPTMLNAVLADGDASSTGGGERGGERGGTPPPALILIDYSANDVLDGMPLERFSAALEAALRYLLVSHPTAAVMLVEVRGSNEPG